MGSGSNQSTAGFIGTKKEVDNYQLKTEDAFWLQKGGAFYPASNLKSFVKFFPGKEAAIEAFAKENNISMNKKEDVIKLINFSNK
jgi:hypothetical protein